MVWPGFEPTAEVHMRLRSKMQTMVGSPLTFLFVFFSSDNIFWMCLSLSLENCHLHFDVARTILIHFYRQWKKQLTSQSQRCLKTRESHWFQDLWVKPIFDCFFCFIFFAI
jgi:hypothetical protein